MRQMKLLGFVLRQGVRGTSSRQRPGQTGMGWEGIQDGSKEQANCYFHLTLGPLALGLLARSWEGLAHLPECPLFSVRSPLMTTKV